VTPGPDPIWRPERQISEELAAALIEGVAPELAPVTLSAFGEGFDNVAYLANGQWVFRFPRRAVAAELIEVETGILPALAPLPVAVPFPTYVGAPDDDFPWSWAGYEKLDGVTGDRAELDDETRVQLAPMLALFLTALHEFPEDVARDLGVPPDRIRRADVRYRHDQAARRLIDAHANRWLEGERFVHILDAVALDWEPRADVLCHGDFYSRHMLFDEGGLCGVIDWGDVHLGDPGVDLMVAHSFLPPAAHAFFRQVYGPIDEMRWRFARLKALHHTLSVLFYAHDVDDAELRREAERALRYLSLDEGDER